MLYHTLSMGIVGVDIEQILCTMSEPLDIGAMKRAWEATCARHDILRARIEWERVEEPVHVIEPAVRIPFTDYDWVDDAGVDRRISDLLREDREHGFELDSPPLMRIAIIRATPERWHCLWTFHHILLDGRSFPVVLRDAFGYYEAFRDGKSYEPPPIPSFQGFVEWVGRQDHSTSEGYWREALRGFHAPTPLPLHNIAPTDPQPCVGSEELCLSTALTAALHSFSRSHDATPNTMIQGAWALLLHHYTGEDDIVFGATRACRRSVDDDSAESVGLLINTLPVRVQVGVEDRLIPWLRAIRRFNVSLREHEHTPLSDVQRWSDVCPGTPLFETLVVFDNQTLDTRLRSQGGVWEHRSFHYQGQTNFPLALIGYADAQLLLRLEFDATVYDSTQAATLLRHLQTLLNGMIADPDACPVAIPYTTVEERAVLVRQSQRRTYPVEACLHQQFERHAREQPEAVALVFEGHSVSYAELDGRASVLARRLRKLGVGRDVLVGLCVDRSVEMVVGILGILKAGGAYVPIDQSYPPDRITFILDDADVAVLVVAGDAAHGLPDSGRRVLRIDDIPPGDDPGTDLHEENLPADPSSLAYVIYTSGSTGRPKGVLVTHANVGRLLHSTDEWYGFGRSDVWTLFHSYAFDFSVWELWGALAYGGRLVIVPYWVSRSPQAFCDLLVREAVTVLNQTPSAFMQLMPVATALGDETALALRWVVFGGEALDPGTLAPWTRRFGVEQPALVNMYGITETTVHVTYRRLRSEDVEGDARSVIGAPLPDLELHVLDSSLRPVPVGVVGELHVGGAGLARGYLNRPELTAERFIPHPFDDTPGARLYRTGDLARRLADGDLEYIGRSDDQVKIRGFRIETGEVEAAISALGSVRQAVVVARPDESGQRHLVAYVVPDGDEPLAIGSLRAALESRLPPYMVPAAFVSLPAIPLTSNGKVDRRALPAPSEERPELDTSYRAPRSSVEERLADIWRRVLRIDRVGIDDNFFALGGDSILTIRVVAEAQRVGLTLSTHDLFEAPTIAALATRTEAGATAPAYTPGPNHAPLTPIQRWFVAQQFTEPDHWNQAVVFECREPLDPAVVGRALTAVAEHHDALRIRLVRDGADWIQRLAGARESVTVRTLGAVSETTFATAVARAQSSLDLSTGPIVHALLADVDGRNLVHLAVHHVAVDGVSWRILREDFETAYDAEERDGEPDLLRSTPFLAWAQSLASTDADALAVESERWNAELDGDHDPLPADVAGANRGANVERDVAVLTSALTGQETATLLKVLPKLTRTQINDVLLTAFATALDPLMSGQQEPIIELEGHGREDVVDGADLSRTVGWFTAIFPVRLPRATGDLLGTLRAVKHRLQQLPRRRSTFGLSRWGAPGEPVVVEPTSSILFNYLGQFDDVVEGSARFRFADAETGPWHGPGNHRTHAVECLCLVRDGAFHVSLMYAPALHRADTARRLLDGFMAALRSLNEQSAEARPLLTPGDFSLVDLESEEIPDLASRYTTVEDVLPLSPIQLLYHSVDGASGDIGLDQWHYTLRGPLDLTAFRRAWEDTVQRHVALRSCFVTDRAGQPLQIVCGRVELPWRVMDWRSDPSDGADDRFEELLRDDRARPFDIASPPLMRITVVRTSDVVHRVIWTHHHLQIDGWSWPIVLDDVAARYAELVDGTPPVRTGPAPSYRRYLQWLADRNESDSPRYWAQTLAQFDPTPVPGVRRPRARGRQNGAGEDRSAEHAVTVGPDAVTRLTALARQHQVTLNTVVQTAWALVLHDATGRNDVAFGATFSGRPADLPDVDEIVGPFVNNLPIRVGLAATTPLGDLLAHVHQVVALAAQHQEVPSPQLHELSGLAGDRRLFESLVVFQNYQIRSGVRRLSRDTSITDFTAPVRTNYAVTLLAVPTESLELSLIFNRARLSDEAATLLLNRMAAVLTRLPDCPGESVRAVLDGLKQISWPTVEPDVVPRGNAGPPPISELERQIAAIWAEVFGLQHVARDDDFFELGGQSVTMLQIHARLRERLATDVSVARLFQFPTVAALAAELGGGTPEPVGPLDDESRGQRQRAAAAAARQRRRGR
jgi:amino acid adenylation domain-containing protein/non-ribosomal peptide synthase protein (TIGR01720 family)